MTFVIGFHCFDGLAICADSEEGDGFSKRYVDKVWHRNVPIEKAVCFGGAGDATAVEKFRDRYLLMMNQETDLKSYVYIESVAEKAREHIQDLHPRLGFDILLSQCDYTSGETHLARSYEGSEALRPIEQGDFACIGMDTSLAHLFVTSIFDSLTGVAEALRLGIYATAMMKIHAHGVSGPTCAWSYKKGDTQWERYLSPWIKSVEEQYPIGDLSKWLMTDWQKKNPDIYKVIDGMTVRPVSYD